MLVLRFAIPPQKPSESFEEHISVFDEQTPSIADRSRVRRRSQFRDQAILFLSYKVIQGHCCTRIVHVNL